jgi:hypothetical protein
MGRPVLSCFLKQSISCSPTSSERNIPKDLLILSIMGFDGHASPHGN